MSEHSVKHSTFTMQRTYSAPPAQVFAAWADRDTKARWFAAHDPAYTLDFRVGGCEAAHGRAEDGTEFVAESVYRDIRADERIVYGTVLHSSGVVSTVSVTTVELVPDTTGTQLVLTEQGTFLDDQEQPEWRRQGTGDWLDALGRELGHSERPPEGRQAR